MQIIFIFIYKEIYSLNAFHTVPVSITGKKIWSSDLARIPYVDTFLMLMNERKRIIYVLRSIWRHIKLKK